MAPAPCSRHGGCDKPSMPCTARDTNPDSPYRKRKEITPTNGGRTAGSATRAPKVFRPGNSSHSNRNASGTPIAAESSTLATEIQMLDHRARHSLARCAKALRAVGSAAGHAALRVGKAASQGLTSGELEAFEEKRERDADRGREQYACDRNPDARPQGAPFAGAVREGAEGRRIGGGARGHQDREGDEPGEQQRERGARQRGPASSAGHAGKRNARVAPTCTRAPTAAAPGSAITSSPSPDSASTT